VAYRILLVKTVIGLCCGSFRIEIKLDLLTFQIYSAEELQIIADLCQKHDVIVLADEVYEWMVYKPEKHIRIGTFSLVCIAIV